MNIRMNAICLCSMAVVVIPACALCEDTAEIRKEVPADIIAGWKEVTEALSTSDALDVMTEKLKDDDLALNLLNFAEFAERKIKILTVVAALQPSNNRLQLLINLLSNRPQLAKTLVEWEIRQAAVVSRSTSMFAIHFGPPLLLRGDKKTPWILAILNGFLGEPLSELQNELIPGQATVRYTAAENRLLHIVSFTMICSFVGREDLITGVSLENVDSRIEQLRDFVNERWEYMKWSERDLHFSVDEDAILRMDPVPATHREIRLVIPEWDKTLRPKLETLWTYDWADRSDQTQSKIVFCIIDDPRMLNQRRLIVGDDSIATGSNLWSILDRKVNDRAPGISYSGAAPLRETIFQRLDVNNDGIDEVFLTGFNVDGKSRCLTVFQIQNNKVTKIFEESSHFGFILFDRESNGNYEIAVDGNDMDAQANRLREQNNYTLYAYEEGKFVVRQSSDSRSVEALLSKLAIRTWDGSRAERMVRIYGRENP